MLTLFLLTASLIFSLLRLSSGVGAALAPFPVLDRIDLARLYSPPQLTVARRRRNRIAKQRHKQRRDNEQFQRAGLREEAEREQHHCHDRARRRA